MREATTDGDTIAAIATAAGRGAIGIVRISGTAVARIAEGMLGELPAPRRATVARFTDKLNTIIDQGMAVFMPGPHSFTGEDVLELQGHGGSAVLDAVLSRTLELGARLARPGEFSERAFLNGKLDLAQAEAVADVIQASSAGAVRAAQRSLSGEFSARVNALVEQVVNLRVQIEADIDFADEPLDLSDAESISNAFHDILARLAQLREQTRAGVILRDGLDIVVAGRPNVGKSSLLNRISGTDAAIVTSIPGTTRDTVKESILLSGVAVTITDTAGIRSTLDPIEAEGIHRAEQAMDQADLVLWTVDAASRHASDMPPSTIHGKCVLVHNKTDLTGTLPGHVNDIEWTAIAVSAKTGAGMAELKTLITETAFGQGTVEGVFTARRRHLTAIDHAIDLLRSEEPLIARPQELLAEDLRLAQDYLNEITGEFTSEDLLGKIFSEFCIGK